jgi:hypothetical protein
MKNLSGFLGLALLATSVPLAHAGLQVTYTVDGGIPVICGPPVAGANPSQGCPSVIGPPLTITLLGASSNSPGGTPSVEDSATVNLINTTTATHTIVINVISTGFNIPVTPPNIIMLSHIGGTVAVGAVGDAGSFISCVDTTNSQIAGCSGTTINAPTIASNLVVPGSFSGDSQTTITSLSASFAVDEQITITLGALENVNFSASTTLIQTPEPMSIAILGGVLLFTTGAIRRKRNQASRV